MIETCKMHAKGQDFICESNLNKYLNAQRHGTTMLMALRSSKANDICFNFSFSSPSQISDMSDVLPSSFQTHLRGVHVQRARHIVLLSGFQLSKTTQERHHA